MRAVPVPRGELSPGDLSKMLSALLDVGRPWAVWQYRVICVLSGSGLRSTEMSALRWGWVTLRGDDSPAQIDVPAFDEGFYPKSSNGPRSIPVLREASDVLIAMRSELGPTGAEVSDLRVFPGETGRSVVGYVKRAAERVGIDHRLTTHSLRVLYGRRCLDAGMPIAQLASVLGVGVRDANKFYCAPVSISDLPPDRCIEGSRQSCGLSVAAVSNGGMSPAQVTGRIAGSGCVVLSKVVRERPMDLGVYVEARVSRLRFDDGERFRVVHRVDGKIESRTYFDDSRKAVGHAAALVGLEA